MKIDDSEKTSLIDEETKIFLYRKTEDKSNLVSLLSASFEKTIKIYGKKEARTLFHLLFRSKMQEATYNRNFLFLEQKRASFFEISNYSDAFDGPLCEIFDHAEAFLAKSSITIQRRYYENTRIETINPTSSLMPFFGLMVLSRDYNSPIDASTAVGPEGYTFVFPVEKSLNGDPYLLMKAAEESPVSNILLKIGVIKSLDLPSLESIAASLKSISNGIITLFVQTSDRKKNIDELSDLDKAIVNYVFRKKTATKKEISDFFEIPPRTASLHIQFLCKISLIKQVDSAHSPQQRYVINDKTDDFKRQD
jgi:hypothetical protein